MSGGSEPLIGHVRVLHAAISIETARASGPGGQHVNTADSAVRLRLALWGLIGLDEAALQRLRRLAGRRLTSEDELLITASEHRSQQRNREIAWQRLRELLQQALRAPKRRKPTRPSRGAVRRRLEHKQRHAQKKARRREDFDE